MQTQPAVNVRVVRYEMDPEELPAHNFNPKMRQRVERAMTTKKWQKPGEIAAKAGVHADYVRLLMKVLVAEGVVASMITRNKQNQPAEVYKMASPDDPVPLFPPRPGEDARPLAECFGGLSYPRSESWPQ